MRFLIYKPDGIGDFILATGCIRLLAAEVGEENLTLCVRDQLAELASTQFPHATIVSLPLATKRKVINLFAVNFTNCLPVWLRIRRMRVDAALSLRSMRDYLDSFLFFSAATQRIIAPENLLCRSRRKPRLFVEWLVKILRRPEILPYPEARPGVPSELECNRLVVSKALHRDIPPDAIVPTLHSTIHASEPCWVCCPLSSTEKKDYPFESWREVFQQIASRHATPAIFLVGMESQRAKLEAFRELLQDIPVSVRVEIPADLSAFVNLLAGASMVFTVDTAASHIACALDRPCLVLFSGQNQGMFGPWTRSAKQSWLLPEYPGGKKKGKWHRALSPDRAAAEALKLLA